MPSRRTLSIVAGVVIAAVIFGVVGHRPGVGILFICAAISVGLLINVGDARSWVVETVWSIASRRRPDVTYARMTGYVIGWSVVLILAFAWVLLAIIQGRY